MIVVVGYRQGEKPRKPKCIRKQCFIFHLNAQYQRSEIFWADKSVIIVRWCECLVMDQFFVIASGFKLKMEDVCTVPLQCANKRHTYLREIQDLLCSIMT